MRYGLISNYRRSWSKKGERARVENQQEYENRYLYSAVSPTTGDSFHLMGIDNADGAATMVFLEQMKKKHPDTHLLIVWDRAPFHRLKALSEMDGVTVIFLPPYSPELSPAERFFGELRKATANRLFAGIGEQERQIERAINRLADDVDAMKRLLGYGWITRQWAEVF